MEVPTMMLATCAECGCENEVNFNVAWLRLAKCSECGRQIGMPRGPSWENLLEAIGVTVSLDWDEQLLAEHPLDWPEETIDDLRSWLALYQVGIRSEIKDQVKRSQARFVGGPVAGKHESEATVGGKFNWSRQEFYYHVRHGCWAVYRRKERNDPRLYFLGYSPSEAKARKGKIEAFEPSEKRKGEDR